MKYVKLFLFLKDLSLLRSDDKTFEMYFPKTGEESLVTVSVCGDQFLFGSAHDLRTQPFSAQKPTSRIFHTRKYYPFLFNIKAFSETVINNLSSTNNQFSAD